MSSMNLVKIFALLVLCLFVAQPIFAYESFKKNDSSKSGNKNPHSYEHFHGGAKTEKINYDSLFNLAELVEQGNEGSTLINNCIEAYGGKEKLSALKSIKYDWRMKAMMATDSIDVIRIVSPGRKYKIEKHVGDWLERRIINGEKCWFQSKDTVISLDNGRYKAELFSYLILRMPLALINEEFTEVRYGKGADKDLDYIYLKKEDSLMIGLGIDKEDYLVKKVAGVIFQNSDRFVFENVFSDYREVEGYNIPHELINISMGLTVGHSKLKSVDINGNVTDSTFEPVPIREAMRAH